MKNIKKFVSIILSIITLSGIFVFPSYAGEVSGIESGASYLINFKNTNMGINVQFAPTSGIGKLCLDSTTNKQVNEIWQFTYVKKFDAYYITPEYRPGAAINALYGASASAGSQARLHDSNINDTASLWKLEKSGSYYRFKNVASGYYLDVDNGRTAAGTRVNLWHNSVGNQQFSLVKVKDSAPIVSPVPSGCYFTKKSNDNGWKGYHDINVNVNTNTPVYAICDGTVTYKQAIVSTPNGRFLYSYGNHIEFVSSDKVYKVIYAHLDRFEGVSAPLKSSQTLRLSSSEANSRNYAKQPWLKSGVNVSKNQILGYIGNTGNVSGATGIHLHIEVYKNGKRVDPTTVFKGLTK